MSTLTIVSPPFCRSNKHRYVCCAVERESRAALGLVPASPRNDKKTDSNGDSKASSDDADTAHFGEGVVKFGSHGFAVGDMCVIVAITLLMLRQAVCVIQAWRCISSGHGSADRSNAGDQLLRQSAADKRERRRSIRRRRAGAFRLRQSVTVRYLHRCMCWTWCR